MHGCRLERRVTYQRRPLNERARMEWVKGLGEGVGTRVSRDGHMRNRTAASEYGEYAVT